MTHVISDACAGIFRGNRATSPTRKIFPALQQLAKRERAGHAGNRSGQVRLGPCGTAQASAPGTSVEHNGGLDPAAFAKLSAKCCGSASTATTPTRATFRELRRQLGDRPAHPLHYLAIPPDLFGEVVKQLKSSGCSEGARVVVGKSPLAATWLPPRELSQDTARRV